MALELYRRKQQEIDDAKALTKTQTKILSVIVNGTGTAVLSELNFNNLIIGKWYRLNVKLQSAGGTNSRAFHVVHGARLIDESSVNSDGSENRAIYTFQATATTIAYNVTVNATGIYGDGTERYTFAQLEELPNHEVTTQFV